MTEIGKCAVCGSWLTVVKGVLVCPTCNKKEDPPGDSGDKTIIIIEDDKE